MTSCRVGVAYLLLVTALCYGNLDMMTPKDKVPPKVKVTEDIDPGGYCGKHTCARNATCRPDTDSHIGYRCDCPINNQEGHYRCEQKCDASKHTACLNGLDCAENRDLSQKCVCSMGSYWSNDSKLECKDVNECKSDMYLCPKDSYCTNLYNDYNCTCFKGYKGIQGRAITCKDIDECKGMQGYTPCEPNSVCLNSEGGYMCQCKEGYRGGPKRLFGAMSERALPRSAQKPKPKEFCKDTDECSDPFSPAECGEHTVCKNTIGSYTCDCEPGLFKKIPGGKSCAPYDICNTEKHLQNPPCHEKATCVDLKGNYTCKCIAGFVGDGFSCKHDRAVCDRCDKNSTVCDLTSDGYKCACKEGFAGMPGSETYCSYKAKCQNPLLNDCDKINGNCLETFPTFRCSCARHYTGDGRTCVAINNCEPRNPCEESLNYTCTSHIGGHTCKCKPGHIEKKGASKPFCTPETGLYALNCSQCDTETQLCEKDSSLTDANVRYTCNCKPGFEMTAHMCCSNVDECSDPKLNDCDTNAFCKDSVPMRGSPKYYCRCKRGYVGNGTKGNCIDDNECLKPKQACPNPNTVCENTIGSYACRCETGYTPRTQTSPLFCVDCDECRDSNCGAQQCPMHSECRNTIGSYRCFCKDGFADSFKSNFSAVNCVNRNECDEMRNGVYRKCERGLERDEVSSSCHHLKCDSVNGMCDDTLGSYFCKCKDGFRLLPNGGCEDVNECKEEQHSCSRETQICENTVGSYKCSCIHGYVQRKDGTCEDKNECEDKTICQYNTDCINSVGSFFCQCKKGYEIVDQSKPAQPRCERPDVCAGNQHRCGNNGKCITDLAVVTGYHCECRPPSYMLSPTRCVAETHCDSEYKCPGNTVCECKEDCCGTTCKCNTLPGYIWVNIPSIVVNENATKLDNRSDAKPIDVCLSAPCPMDETCVYTGPQQYKCKCKEGLQRAGPNCTDVNECLIEQFAKSCPARSTCSNVYLSYECKCEKGFKDSQRGRDKKRPVCVDVNECTSSYTSPCKPHQDCANTVGSFECKCQPAYRLNANGGCDDIDVCKETPGVCGAYGVCHDSSGSYHCQCKPGFVSKNNNCTDIDECDPGYPMNNCMPTSETCENTIGSFKCNCVKGFDRANGTTCTNVNECEQSLDDCDTKAAKDSVPLVCKDTIGAFTCVCPADYYEAESNVCKLTDICAKGNNCSVLSETCSNQKGGFNCNCRPGFEKDPKCTGDSCHCISIPYCERDKPCGKNARCIPAFGSYSCQCLDGYIGDAAKECTLNDVCKAKPCAENEFCIETSDGKEKKQACECNKGFMKNPIAAKGCIPNPCFVENGGCPKKAICEVFTETDKPTVRCKCDNGYELNAARSQCEQVDYCGCDKSTPYRCISSNCPHNSTCNSEVGTFRCECHRGFNKLIVNGLPNCIDKDECTEAGGAPVCPESSKCVNTVGSYECVCPKGSVMSNKRRCEADVVCRSCGFCRKVEHTYCRDYGNGSAFCDCINGYKGNPQINCVVHRMCDDFERCKTNERCDDFPGGFRCICPTNEGYRRNKEGNCISQKCEAHPVYLCDPLAQCINTETNFTCKCPPGFILSGSKCDDVDECITENRCDKVKQTCRNYPGSYTCRCRVPEYIDGPQGTCINNNECKTGQYSCPENSVCVDKDPGYDCICPTIGFAPTYDANRKLQKCENINECLNTAAPVCSPHANCTDTIGRFICTCWKGYYGNGVVCHPRETCEPACGKDAFCTQFGDTYKCQCKSGYQGDGQTCSPIEFCKNSSSLCHKRSTCQSVPGSYKCTCKEPYAGDGVYICERFEYCELSDCPAISSCKELDEQANKRWFTCACPKGYAFNEKTRICDDVDECKTAGVCPTTATCQNRIGSFTCICPRGYAYQDSQCLDRNECFETRNRICMPYGTCENEPGSYHCNCFEGYRPAQNRTVCEDFDSCVDPKTNNCDVNTTTCRDFSGGYSCDCRKGFEAIVGTQSMCKDKDECTAHTDNCSPFANCINTVGSFYCSCKVGFTGTGQVCAETSSCHGSDAKVCQANAYCVETISKAMTSVATCVCQTGFVQSGVNGSQCLDDDECPRFPCPARSTCLNTVGSYQCNCNLGYVRQGAECVDDNECNRKPCGTNTECINTVGSFECKCVPGTTGNPLEKCDDTNECTTADRRFRHQCALNADCVNIPFSYYCRCRSGFAGDGKTSCIDVNECEANPCPECAKCLNTEGSFQCICKKGWERFGEVCSTCTDINECNDTANPVCDKNAVCTNNRGGFECACRSGWRLGCPQRCPDGSPRTCQNDDECKDPTLNQCNQLNSRCEDTPGDYQCNCKSGYAWLPDSNKICQDVNECLSNGTVCNTLIAGVANKHQCFNEDGDYKCLCDPGFLNTDKHTCADINECQPVNPCHKDALCLNSVGSFKCTCKDGWSGDGHTCTEIDKCADVKLNSCDKNTTGCNMRSGTGSYVCTCLNAHRPLTGIQNKCVYNPPCTVPNGPSDKCSPLEICKNQPYTKPNFYACDCKSGFKRNELTKECEDIDECKAENKDKECSQFKKDCQNIIGSYVCVCKSGYKLNAKNICVDIDECAEQGILKHNCTGNYCCENTVPGFKCACSSPYVVKKSSNGDSICVGPYYCEDSSWCPDNSRCTENRTCVANPGCELTINNKSPLKEMIIVDVDECKKVNPCGIGPTGPCNTTCTNSLCNYKCNTCPSGFSMDVTGCYCEPDCKLANPCVPWIEECIPHAKCVAGGPGCRTKKNCACLSQPPSLPYVSGDSTSICDMNGQSYKNRFEFYRSQCEDDKCGLPYDPMKPETSANFNYFGDCKSPAQIGEVKCETGKPVVMQNVVLCTNNNLKFTFAFANCASKVRAKRSVKREYFDPVPVQS